MLGHILIGVRNCNKNYAYLYQNPDIVHNDDILKMHLHDGSGVCRVCHGRGDECLREPIEQMRRPYGVCQEHLRPTQINTVHISQLDVFGHAQIVCGLPMDRH